MGHSVPQEDNSSRKVTTKAAMIFALIIVGLLIGTANFLQVMSHSDHGHGDAHGTEHAAHDAHGSHGEEAHKVDAATQGNTEPAATTPPATTPQEEAEAGTATPAH